VSASFSHIRTICSEAIASEVVPGLAVAVGQGGQTRLLAAYGQRQVQPHRLPAREDTLWDLASLTKALSTSVLCMQAVAAGAVSLDEPLEPPLPATVRQVLAHAAGFSAHLHLYRDVLGPVGQGAGTVEARRGLLNRVRQATRVYQPGTRSVYSDLGFILLGAFLEKRLGAGLDQLARERIFAPLGLGEREIGFRPVDPAAPAPPLAAAGQGGTAATQLCPLRGRVLVGEVDDLNAFALGGVAGHAGLFGTAGAVALLAHALCAAFRGAGLHAGDRPLVDRDVLRLFWSSAQIPASTWRLGWDGPAATGSLAGDRLTRAAVGHTGFTGCSLWIDPGRETFVVFLSNRVHPTARQDPRFAALRRDVNDAALEDLGYQASSLELR
jgi:CubicO group peptidase (beta-lactamase class C family)